MFHVSVGKTECVTSCFSYGETGNLRGSNLQFFP